MDMRFRLAVWGVGGWGVTGELEPDTVSMGTGGFNSSVSVTSGCNVGLDDGAPSGSAGGSTLKAGVAPGAGVLSNTGVAETDGVSTAL